ncbi:MAG: TolC family protein [Chitinophagaceae bacterium]|nr:TolC family protein [Chitinophagaceae bacterium]
MRTVFSKINKISLLIGILLFMASGSKAQKTLLDSYIDSAWKSNLVVQQKSIKLEKARQALDIAKTYFLPEVNFQFGYQTAGGGRNIELPLGTLLNDAYRVLNQLTGTNNFPQLEDQSVNFFPRNFHDAKVRTTMPIINPDIRYNREIAEKQIVLSEYEVEIYKRDLALAVKTAYFQYLSALKVVEIYENTLTLAEEGRRVNQRLLDNGKGLHAYILRSDSEIESVKASISTARQQASNAAHYFNFLLNREADAPIDTDYSPEVTGRRIQGISADELSATTGREELKALQQSVSVYESVVNLRKSVFSPRLNSFLDLGNQSENWKFNNQSRYYLLGLQLEIPIFTGQRNRLRVKQSQLDVAQASVELQQAMNQLQLAARTSVNNLRAAQDQYAASSRQLESAATYQRLIERGYREGVNTFIETIDARNQFTLAQLQETINQYKVLIAAADLERQTASYPIK